MKALIWLGSAHDAVRGFSEADVELTKKRLKLAEEQHRVAVKSKEP